MGPRIVIWALVVAVLALGPGVASAASDPPAPGQTTTGTVTSNGTEFPFILHTPGSHHTDKPVPLLVMVHGAQTTADQEMRVTGFNQLADREGFAVLYPEVDATGQQLPGPLNQSWNFYDPRAYFRGNNDTAAIALMTHTAMSKLRVDPERVYLVGVSAGGLMVSGAAADYPDLYAAVALVASAGYADGFCFTNGVGLPVQASAQLAFQAMGTFARVVPMLGIGSDGDQAFPANCMVKAVEQALRTNNLVVSGSQDAPLALTPSSTGERQVPGGYGYTVSTFRDPGGCRIGERWIIHGMPHAWPGGTTDPTVTGYGDRKGPDGAQATWDFLKRYRKSDTAMPCAEARGDR
jgi:poly(hydroxyalkanoate) depolymerase family esterase